MVCALEKALKQSNMKGLYKTLRIVLAVVANTFLTTVVVAQGDDCSTAIAIVSGVHVADGPNSGSGASNVCYFGLGLNADWYSFTPINDGLIEVFSCVGFIDTRLSIFDGTCASLNCLAFDDDGCPIGFGSQVIGLPVTGGVTYYFEWDDYWATLGFTWELLFHDCSAPQASFTVVNDCINFEYSIEVDITDIGSAVTVDITNDNGAPIVSGATIGVYTIGPFISGTFTNINLVHDIDPFCDLIGGPFNNPTCPLVSCGPDNYTYCYVNNENTEFLFQAASTDSLGIQFNEGGIETFYDGITVYDGDNIGAPVLFSGDNAGDLTGLVLVSTNPGGYLLLVPYSDGSISCNSGGVVPPWNWDVACFDCTQPTSTFEVVEDCIHKEFFIEVDITDIGDAGTIDIINDIGISPTLGVGVGTYMIGPIEMNNFIGISLVHDANPLCSIRSIPLIAYFDSCSIDCGNSIYDYCYLNNDTAWFLFRSGSGQPVTMYFYDGMIAENDQLVIYNGRTSTSAVLFNTINGYNLQGISVQSNNPDGALLMRLFSDGSISCNDSIVSPELKWLVGCGAVGVEEQYLALDNILIYPNPSSGPISILYDSPLHQKISISVIDGLGRIIQIEQALAGQGSVIEMDLSSTDVGVYFVQIDTPEGSTYEKLVIRD